MTDLWRTCRFPVLDALDRVRVPDAVLSRADSGAIAWDRPSPRSYIRGAVYDRTGRLVAPSQRLGGVNADLVITVNPGALSPEEMSEAAKRRLTGRWVYAGSWMQGFGHFITETLPTLWPLLDDAFDGVVAHRFTSRQSHRWQYDLLALLTDLPVEIVDHEPATVDELTVGDRAYRYQQAIDPHAAEVWARVAAAALPSGDREQEPLFLSRSRLARGHGNREFANGSQIEEVFAAHGFQVLHPQETDVVEQIRAVHAAPVLAGQSGSALHLAAFARPGARVIEVGDTRTKDTMVGTQQAIATVKNQQVAMVPFRDDGAGGLDADHLDAYLTALL